MGPNQIAVLLEEFKRKKIPFVDLTESNPTKCGFSYPPQILQALTHPKNLQYHPHPFGLDETRAAVCRYYQEKGIAVKPLEVILTSSTSEGYSFLFQLLANVDDAILSARPSYPLFSFLGDLHNIHLHPYDLCYERGWQIDREFLEQVLQETPRVRAMVMVNPNNPTGSFIKPDELGWINALAQRDDFALISDEVFLDYPLEESSLYQSLAANPYQLTFVLGGISKILGLPQMKLSWIVVSGPQEIKEDALRRLEVIADTYLSVNTPVQNALPAWMDLRTGLQGDILRRVRANWEFLQRCFGPTTQAELLRTEGGWYAMIRPSSELDEEALTIQLLKEDHILVHPGYFFDCLEGSHIVLSLLPPEEIFQEGVGRLMKKLENSYG